MSVIAQATLSISNNNKLAARDRLTTACGSCHCRVVKVTGNHPCVSAWVGPIVALIVSLRAVASPSVAAVGDLVATVSPQPAVGNLFCSIGLAFDGSLLYFNRCSDPNIYAVSTQDGSLQETRSLIEPNPLNPKIPEWPAAMAYDPTQDGLWITTQMGVGGTEIGDCGNIGIPIYFWAFNAPGPADDTVSLVFTILFSALPANPATGDAFFSDCTIAGLVYNASSDEIWISDDRNRNIGVFRPDGMFIRGYDAVSVHASMFSSSGLAIGDVKLYLANGSVGDVFRANRNANTLTLSDQLVDGSQRQVDMACDPVTFAPIEVMWVRTSLNCSPETNQSCDSANDLITAYEIEPGGCGPGPQLGACCNATIPSCRDVPQTQCQGNAEVWTAGVLCANLNPPCFETHRLFLLDRTGSMETAVLADGRTRCHAAWETANSEIVSFFATHPIGSSVSVWTFAGSTAAPLTAGFVDEALALASLAPLGNTACAGLTPLPDSICDSVDAIVAAFPTAPAATLEISISSDGRENSSSGPCDGPASLAGLTCGEFALRSWQQLVCDHAIGKAVMLVKLWGDTTPPLFQASQAMDTETGLPQVAAVSDAVFFQALATATGGTFTFIDDNPPQPTGQPAFGVTGACCLADGTCRESITEAECAVLGGTHQGNASICSGLPGQCVTQIPTVSELG